MFCGPTSAALYELLPITGVRDRILSARIGMGVNAAFEIGEAAIPGRERTRNVRHEEAMAQYFKSNPTLTFRERDAITAWLRNSCSENAF